MVILLGWWLLKSILRGVIGRMFGQAQQRAFQQQQQQQQSQRKSSGGIHVDVKPRKSRKNKTSDDFKGGDYIEYEEVD